MRRQIRKSMFETNSSSVHALIIPKALWEEELPREIRVHHGEYGWAFERYYRPNDRLSYLCQGIFSHMMYQGFGEKPIGERLEAAKNAIMEFVKPIEDEGVDVLFDRNYFVVDEDDEWGWRGHVDHSNEFAIDVLPVFEDSEKLKRFVFEGKLYTANDNTEGMSEFLNYGFDPRESEVVWKGN